MATQHTDNVAALVNHRELRFTPIHALNNRPKALINVGARWAPVHDIARRQTGSCGAGRVDIVQARGVAAANFPRAKASKCQVAIVEGDLPLGDNANRVALAVNHQHDLDLLLQHELSDFAKGRVGGDADDGAHDVGDPQHVRRGGL